MTLFVPTDSLDVRVMFSEVANLTYQLDAVSGVLAHLDPGDYQALWRRDFLKTAEDEARLKSWGALKKRYYASANLEGASMPFEAPPRSVSLFDGIRVAAFRAKTDEEFLGDAALLMVPADVAKMGEILRYFSPRFHVWWRKEAEGRGKAFVKRVDRLMRSEPTRGEIERFRRFYGPSLPERAQVYFSLLYRPNLAKAPTSGQQIGNVGIAEFLPDETPEKRLDVVLHEFCHFLYNSRSDEDNLALQNAFANSGDPAAKPSYNLLNEGMATALGNGIVGRSFRTASEWPAYLARPRSLYNNANIDRAAKRLLPMMDAWLASVRTMKDPTFAPEYIAAMKGAFGAELTRPALFLNEAYILVDEKFGLDFARKVRRDLNIASAYMTVSGEIDEKTLEDYVGQPNLSALFVVPTARLEALVARGVVTAGEAEAIRAEVAAHKSALFGHTRSANAHSFLVIADDAAEAAKRVGQLAGAPVLFSGVLP
jgi:hypothetical protein